MVENKKRIRVFIFIIIRIIMNLECDARLTNHLFHTANKLDDNTNTPYIGNTSNDINLGYFHIVEGISKGVELAIEECKHQFKWDQWNCPVTTGLLLSSKSSPNRGTKVQTTREVSYLQAISSAGIMYQVTKKCNHPSNDICGCDSNNYRTEYPHSADIHWKWGGCNHNVRFGEKVSKMVLGTDTKAGDAITALKSHNERAGHKAVTKTLNTICKCHGVTGSCTLRTCWKQLSDFRDIGALLKNKYRKAKQVQNTHFKSQTSNKVRHQRFTKISKRDLVFVDRSPNYCHADNSVGFLGTIGRECTRLQRGMDKNSMKKWERNSCRRLCRKCGYKVGSFIIKETFDCDCKFKWCCTVHCKQCQRNVTKYFCK